MSAPRRRSTTLVLGLALVVIASLPAGGLGTAAAAKWPEAMGRLNNQFLGDCDGAPSGGDVGTVWARRVAGNLVSVKVRIEKGQPNQTYVINVSCAGAIGTVTTDDEGKGTVRLPATAARGLTARTLIVIDVHLADPCCGDASRATGLSLPLL